MPNLTEVRIILPGAGVPVGETIKVPERSAAALVADGWAEFLDQEATETPQGDEKDPGGTNTLPDPPKEQDGANSDAQGEELAKVRKAIDNKFKRDDLATTAKDLGVEFAFDAKKAEIVEAVIEAGKAEALLQA